MTKKAEMKLANLRKTLLIGVLLVIFCLGIFAGNIYGNYFWQGLRRASWEANN